MMYVDKNADGHVMDQNGDRILGEIAYVPFGARIRSKRSSCMQLFFFFLLEKNEHKTCLPMVTTKWGFQSCFLEDQRSWILDVLPKGPRIWILDVLSRGPMNLKFGRAFQRSKNWNFGKFFQEVHWNWILDVLPRGPRIWILDVLPRGLMDLKFGPTT